MKVIAYLILCLLAGYLGRHRFIGFWGFLILGLVLTPLVAFLVLLLTHPKKAARSS